MRRLVFLLTVAATTLHAQHTPAWTLIPEIRIGGPERGEKYELTRPVLLAPSSDGSLHVVEATTQDIRVFDGNGNLVRTVGRRGAGPGEFNLISGIGFIGDTMWVTDMGLRRVSLFGRDGKFLRTIQRDVADPRAASSDDFMFVSVSALLPNGMAVGRGSYPAASIASGKVRGSAILLLTPGGRTVDTIVHIPLKNTQMSFASGERRTFVVQRFSDSPLPVIAPTVSRIFVIDRSVAASTRDAKFRVSTLGVEGDTLWNRSYAYVPKRLSAAIVDSVLSSMEKSFAKAGTPLTQAQIRSQLFAPNFRTPVEAAFAGQDGSLWLKREAGAATVDYSVISPHGDLVGSLTVNRNVVLRAATATHVWGVETDADDVPTVVRYRIKR